MSAPARKMLFPGEWIADHVGVLQAEVVSEWVDKATGDRIWCARAMLSDGTNLLGLSWPHGTNFMRVGPHNNWSLEEKLAPPQAITPAVRDIWRILVDAAANALKLSTAENGGLPS